MARPSQLLAYLFGLAGVPDIHGAKVRAAGFRIADTLNDGHLPLVIELLEWSHGRIEANGVIDRQYLFCRNPDTRPVVEVQGVTVRDDRVQGVVAPG